MIELKDIQAGYNKKPVLIGVSMLARKGEIVALIGPNGAGKSTVIKTAMGLIKARRGDVLFNGVSIKGKSPYENVRNGIAYVPQGNTVFSDLTVTENLHMGGFTLPDKKMREGRIKEVFSLFPEIEERRNMDAGNLSGGEKQMLALGRALMLRPEGLLLDEPSLGLSPKAVRKALATIRDVVCRFKMSCLIVEQNVKAILEISDRVYAMRLGKVVLEDIPANLTQERIKTAFLGS